MLKEDKLKPVPTYRGKNENHKRNGKREKTKVTTEKGKTTAKGKMEGMSLMEAEERRKEDERIEAYWTKGVKREKYNTNWHMDE